MLDIDIFVWLLKITQTIEIVDGVEGNERLSEYKAKTSDNRINAMDRVGDDPGIPLSSLEFQ